MVSSAVENDAITEEMCQEQHTGSLPSPSDIRSARRTHLSTTEYSETDSSSDSELQSVTEPDAIPQSAPNSPPATSSSSEPKAVIAFNNELRWDVLNVVS